MECERQLDDAERRAEMAARPGDGADDRLAELRGEDGELALVEAAEIARPGEALEDGGHGLRWLLER